MVLLLLTAIHIHTSGMIRATQAIAWTNIFPYAYYMIQSFGEVPDQDIAFYAGLLVATFTFCEFLSAMVWARVSHRIGRKPTSLIGCVCGAVASLTLGLSSSISMAVASRAFGGLCNSNVSLVQTCTGKIANKDQQGDYLDMCIIPLFRCKVLCKLTTHV